MIAKTVLKGLKFLPQVTCCGAHQTARYVRADGLTVNVTRTVKDDDSLNYDLDVLNQDGERVGRRFGLDAAGAEAVLNESC